jgi:hypothetical protein
MRIGASGPMFRVVIWDAMTPDIKKMVYQAAKGIPRDDDAMIEAVKEAAYIVENIDEEIKGPKKKTLDYLFIYLFLILACNRKVMVEATYSNYKVGSLAITPGPHRDMPRSGHSVRGCSPPLLSLCMFHLASSVPGALLARRPPRRVVLHFLLPSPPIFSSFSHLCFLHSSYQYIRE